jgi:hypothetical protein
MPECQCQDEFRRVNASIVDLAFTTKNKKIAQDTASLIPLLTTPLNFRKHVVLHRLPAIEYVLSIDA